MTRRVTPPRPLQIGTAVGFKSEYPAGFIGICTGDNETCFWLLSLPLQRIDGLHVCQALAML